jgi:predicted HTH transcriptional regulator
VASCCSATTGCNCFPDAWIQAGRFDGTDRSTIADHGEFKGSLLAGIEQAMAFIEKHLFRFNYGTDNRGANVTVSFAEDERLGAMALRVTADGY